VATSTYLHELTTFPKGKHDDQADSTSQALDWFNAIFGGPMVIIERLTAAQIQLRSPPKLSIPAA
jgi:hypothetical protein